MMSLFGTEPSTGEIPVDSRIDPHLDPRIHFEAPAPEEADEFEIVLGRTQLASVLFVATVVVAVFSSFAYLAGKSIAPAPKTVIERVVEPAPAAPPAAKLVTTAESPIFAEPKQGALYLQMGAVEKGIAVIFAEGLRKHGFDAFVAPGPNDHIFRVLIGPLADQAAYERTRKSTNDLGLNTFGRKFPQETQNAGHSPAQGSDAPSEPRP
jgi:hypothetical protein